jgi:hypothetical protein
MPHAARPMYVSFDEAHNKIGDLGCKYLSKAQMPSLKSLSLGTFLKIQRGIILDILAFSISPSRNGHFWDN